MKRDRKKSILRIISDRKLKLDKKKHIISILAIILTASLITSLFSLSGSLIKSIQDNTIRLIGTSGHAGVRAILPSDYEKLSKDSLIRESTYRIHVSYAQNKELEKLPTQIDYAQEKEAKWAFCFPSTGKMPESINEIATSTLVLDALNIPHKLGEEVELSFEINGTMFKEKFKLSGFWDGQQSSKSQGVWVSKLFCDKYVPTPIESYYIKQDGNYSGYWFMQMKYGSNLKIEQKTRTLLERNNFDLNEIGYNVNWAYISEQLDFNSMLPIITILIIVCIAGYLIIFNIFYINVSAQINQFGLYKTLGTSDRQIKKIITRQTMVLSLIGIPIGLILGTMFCKILLPVVIKILGNSLKPIVSVHPIIYLISIVFSFITTYLSCIYPSRIAAKVSPIEAIRYIGNDKNSKKIKKYKLRRKAKVSMFGIAKTNLIKNKGKIIITVISLSLSLIILCSIFSITQGFNLDKFVGELAAGDFTVLSSVSKNYELDIRSVLTIDDDYLKIVDNLENTSNISKIYCADTIQILDDKGIENAKNIMKNYGLRLEGERIDMNLQSLNNHGMIPCFLYGLDEYALSKLSIEKGHFDEEKFKTGDYILITAYMDDFRHGILYNPGDIINIELPDGISKKMEVMAVVDIPNSLSVQYRYIISTSMILPQQFYLSHSIDSNPFEIVLNVEDEYEQQTNDYFNEIFSNNSDITYFSKNSYIEQFYNLKNMFFIVGIALAAILAIIGIMNFMNTIIMSILARKRQFAMMQAIGMTRRQLRKILIWEGEIYAFLTILFSLTVGSGIGMLIIKLAVNQFWFFDYTYTILPMLFCLPILSLIAYIVPIFSYDSLCKKSIIKELHTNE